MLSFAKEGLLESASGTLSGIYDMVAAAPGLSWEEVKAPAALFVVDMINGFVREGVLQSPRVERLIPRIKDMMEKANKRGLQIVAFADNHPEHSPEFGSYPQHCLSGSSESEMVDELRQAAPYTLVRKNSTNGALSAEFQRWWAEHQEIQTFILVGDCTDICILQLALWLKAAANELNRYVRVVVPIDATETYDLGLHQGDLMHLLALYNMSMNGIEIAASVQ